MDYNGGVISDNVAVRDGNLVLTGLGNLYEGLLSDDFDEMEKDIKEIILFMN